MINLYEFFELIERIKNEKINPVLKFQRYRELSNQPERLNDLDHIVNYNDMICDSPNNANK